MKISLGRNLVSGGDKLVTPTPVKPKPKTKPGPAPSQPKPKPLEKPGTSPLPCEPLKGPCRFDE